MVEKFEVHILVWRTLKKDLLIVLIKVFSLKYYFMPLLNNLCCVLCKKMENKRSLGKTAAH